MGISADLAMFRAKLNAAVDWAMQGYVAAAAEKTLQDAIQSEVYDAYTPKVYERRMYDGGLIDMSRDNLEENYDAAEKLLTVRNINRDDFTGRLVAPVVESGIGYTFVDIGPRPFHKVAEQRMISDGTFDEAMQAALTARGFIVRKI